MRWIHLSTVAVLATVVSSHGALAQHVAGDSTPPHHHPAHGSARHAHGHGALHFEHPLVAESVSPDTKLRGSYVRSRPGGMVELELEGEYAFTHSFSIEVASPYDQTERRFGATHVSFKGASYALAEHGVLLGFGTTLMFPTGPAEESVPEALDSPRAVHVEPFVNGGVQRGRLQLTAWLKGGARTRRVAHEGVTLGWNAAALFAATPRFQTLLEYDGGTLAGAGTHVSVHHITPGFKVQPFGDPHLVLAAGLSLPVGRVHDFDRQTLLSVFYHF